MLPLAFAFIVFLFLLVGAVAFVLSALVPRLRRFAFSSSLWIAVWGPCTVLLVTLAGVGIFTGAAITQGGHLQAVRAPQLLKAVGWSYLVCGVLGTLVVATATAWIHQALIQRVTFALFRIYATLVAGGIGSVFGWAFGWWIAAHSLSHGWALWLASMLVLIPAFGVAAYKSAGQLRETHPPISPGSPPKNLPDRDSRKPRLRPDLADLHIAPTRIPIYHEPCLTFESRNVQPSSNVVCIL
ncbi:hypothetical protein AciX9_2030 [Granulicella tundricola MP5ACTX9]|uniref:Uncharacterized protein n=1 Tax=Granulicella tundricola (strain ATCC BAA-1859 / DSM 23138 / MP5ACTX9) TaxID=1198114 RepID=E8X1C1_GRATM|nr:hypothetical protein AciX9_2030 [Granulicella tundricola MP5ACTX9]